jgi:RNA polymerase-binding transcription factor DksA
MTMPSTAKSKKSKPMTRQETLAYFESRLLEERNRVVKELGNYNDAFNLSAQDSSGESAYSFHMADQGTDAMEREKAFLFASQEGRFLWHIDQALRRLYRDPDNFGKCHNCGKELAFERLDALPHARYCIDCKQREEESKKLA